uniref:Calpain catalytic domain-containing protein n=1 Tax=Mesocestoides corti TaxID=53468 RepID=A0A5K3EIE5_MESCO
MVSISGVQNFMSSVGITLKPKIMSSTDAYGNVNTFAGIDTPFVGRIGFNITPGSVKFGRFQDPRATIRNQIKNRVPVDAGSGKSSSHPVPASTGGQITTKGMTYEDIKKNLKGTGQLFEDPDFPAVGSSLFYSMSAPRGIEWKRPKEICNCPKFVSGGTSRFDVRQGELGDCWLLAAVANLSLYQDLLEQVVPPDQDFDSDYCGVFRFTFWRFGEWVEVVVDDRLPTRNGHLVFMHSTDSNEFWSALLEKAYAKLFGSYEALRGGSTVEALEDFTGGLAEFYDLRGKQPADLSKILTKSYARRTLMACSIGADPNVVEAELPNGLIRGHAYSITKIANVTTASGPVQLIRIRNPWGNEAEWKGRWSDKSPEWCSVSEEQRRELGLNFDADGEFWMCYNDFVSEFEKLEMCALGPQSLEMTEGSRNVAFEMTIEHGGWQPGVNAGGCRNFLDTFWTNPQYRVHVEDADEGDDENLGTLIVGLMQKDRRKMRKQGADLLTIGFMIYALKEPRSGLLDMNFFKYNAAVARSPAFINTREVSGRFRLPPGDYVIVPSTFAKNERADFLLRIFSERLHPTEQMDDTVGMEDPQEVIKSRLKHRFSLRPQQHRGAVVPEPINESQVAALKNAFEKVSGPDGEVTADELIDILNVAFTKELNEGREGNQPEVPNNKPPAAAPSRVSSKGLSFLCCGLGEKAENANSEAGPTTAKPGAEGGDNDFAFEGFNIETCRSLISMMDVDRSGSLDFEEFKSLWETLRLWKGIFKKFDADNSGTMSSFELRNALNFAGFHVDNATFSSLVLRFSNRDRILRFDDYIICCARLRTAFETVRSRPSFGGAELLNVLLYL